MSTATPSIRNKKNWRFLLCPQQPLVYVKGGLEESVTLATFDRQLWQAGRHGGLLVFPADLASPSCFHNAIIVGIALTEASYPVIST
jgi:hypothetical protein